MATFIRSPFNYDVRAASLAAGLACDPESGVTQQQFKEECDINEILRRFGVTGELPRGLRMPLSGDFTGVDDFQSAMNLVREAQGAFMELSGELRARFSHDPQKLIDFLENPDNKDEARKLGLLEPVPEKTRDVVQAVDELAQKLVPPVAK